MEHSTERRTTLRHALKLGTRALHDRLDMTLGPLATGDGGGYAAFLAINYAARAAIEAALPTIMPPIGPPPATAPLLAEDLACLGMPVPPIASFRFPAGGDPLGLAWALGGSSLGNKAMLRERRRRHLGGPVRFLSDGKSAAYFTRLLPELEGTGTSHRAAAAIAAANAVFDTFLAATGSLRMSRAA